MNRRQFLSMFSAAAAATVLASSGLIVAYNAEIILSKFDLRFRPPSDWHKYVGDEFVDAFPEENMVKKADFGEPESVLALMPILGFSKQPEPVFEFNPQILVFSGQLNSTSEDLLIISMLADETFSSSVDDVEVLVPPRRRNRNEFESTESRVTFRFETTNGLVCRAVRHLEFLIHSGMLYGFMITNESTGDLLEVQEAFLKSIHTNKTSAS